ncbi:MAG: hypothetical protein CFE27_14680 [Alphaproteobacteria bacterium PA1]|nr:MAG: hypothetical protein CFE27_14680 [Alphaproteobacteria bacterium PA1]
MSAGIPVGGVMASSVTWDYVKTPLEKALEVVTETIATDHTRRIIDLETRVSQLEAALAKMEESK